MGALSTIYPSKVLEFIAYQSLIIRCYKDFDSPAWVQYDRAFRRQAAVSKHFDWSRVNTTQYSLCFACCHCLIDNHPFESCPEAPQSTALIHPPPAQRPMPTNLATSASVTHRTANSVGICRLFNARDGPRCFYKACRYAHACMKCKGGHPASACNMEWDAGVAPQSKCPKNQLN